MKYVFKTKPDPYQVEAIANGLRKRRYGIFFQQRVGKTKTAIDLCGAINVKYGCKKVLVVSPLSARGVWVQQIEEHLGYENDVYVYPKSSKERAAFAKRYENPERLLFVIINYDLITNDYEKLKRWAPDIIVFDEIHKLKSASGRRSKIAYKLSEKAKFVYGLSGTPIPKKWYDVFGVMRAINQDVFGTSFTGFKAKWAIMGGYMGKEAKWCKDPEALSRAVAEHSIRVLREDVMAEPQMESVIIPVTLEPKAMEMYRKLKRDAMVVLDEETDTKVIANLAIILETRVAQLAGGFIPDDTGVLHRVSTAKQEAFRELVRDVVVEDEEPAVVFYRFSAECNVIKETLEDLGITYNVVNGSVSEEMRNEAFKAFQSGEAQVIVLQISTGSEGIKLDRAHINIYYSMSYRLFDFQQSRDRVMGRGQTKDVTNYLIAAEKTVDYKIIRTLKEDEEIVTGISDRFKWMLEE